MRKKLFSEHKKYTAFSSLFLFTYALNSPQFVLKNIPLRCLRELFHDDRILQNWKKNIVKRENFRYDLHKCQESVPYHLKKISLKNRKICYEKSNILLTQIACNQKLRCKVHTFIKCTRGIGNHYLIKFHNIISNHT